MTQSASERDGEIPQAHCEHKGHANTFIQNEHSFALKLGYIDIYVWTGDAT